MSELVIVANELRKDMELWHQLIVDAEKCHNIALLPKLEAELAEMKEMLHHIEAPEIHRHLRLISNEGF